MAKKRHDASGMTLEQLENGTPADKVITLKAIFKTKHAVQPAFSTKENWYKGVDRISDREKENRDYFVDPVTTKLILEEGVEFDLNNEIDAINWKWVQHLPEVAHSFEEAQHSPEAMFYVEMSGRESAKKNKEISTKFKAIQKVLEDAQTNYINRALLLGFDMEGSHPEEVKEFLLTMAERNPERVIEIYDNKLMGIRLLFIKAEKEGIITKESGLYKYGTTVLGVDEKGAIQTLSDRGNKELVDLLDKQVNPEYHASDDAED